VKAAATSGGLSRYVASGVTAVVVLTMLGVAGLRLSGYEPDQSITSPVIESCLLRFEDADAGRILVYNHANGELLAELDPGTDSFIRGVMRALARERRAHSVSMEEPFELARHEDGRLVLADSQIGREINLIAFGPTNAGSFDRILRAGLADS
jgi:putative photosynthetic complex assembly protein